MNLKKEMSRLVEQSKEKEEYAGKLRNLLTSSSSLSRVCDDCLEERIEELESQSLLEIDTKVLNMLDSSKKNKPLKRDVLSCLRATHLIFYERRQSIICEDKDLRMLSESIFNLISSICCLIEGRVLSQTENDKLIELINDFESLEHKYKGVPLRNVPKTIANHADIKIKNGKYVKFFKECSRNESVSILCGAVELLEEYHQGHYTPSITKSHRFVYRYGVIHTIITHLVKRYLPSQHLPLIQIQPPLSFQQFHSSTNSTIYSNSPNTFDLSQHTISPIQDQNSFSNTPVHQDQSLHILELNFDQFLHFYDTQPANQIVYEVENLITNQESTLDTGNSETFLPFQTED
jgi:hypothetical protein